MFTTSRPSASAALAHCLRQNRLLVNAMKPAVALSLLLVLLAGEAVAATAIGKVDRVQGEAQGTVDGTTSALSAQAPVFAGEAISTGVDARVGLTFNDGTTLTLGENASLTLDDFVFRPAGETRLRVSVIGAFRFVSGKLGAHATRDAEVSTPVATIGVRGTDFWGGPINGQFGVVVLEGTVTVTTRAGVTTLRTALQGTDIAGADAAPGEVKTWAKAKLDRAIATVTFRQ
jgi:hypothetical protein